MKRTRTSRGIGRRWWPALIVALSVALVVPRGSANAIAAASPDKKAPAVSYTYDADGRLATVTNKSGTATYHYDAEGNVLSITSTAPPRGAALRAKAVPAPVIVSVHPSTVASGGTVTIDGSGFAAKSSADVVRIGALVAPVVAATASRLVVTAPPGVGGAVVVRTPGGTDRGADVTVTGAVSAPTSASAAREAHPVVAPSGVTALSGLVEDNNGSALAGVSIGLRTKVGAAEADTTTDATGHFLFVGLASGSHQLVIAGDHIEGKPDYGVYTEPVQIPPGNTTVLPWVTYLTPLDLKHAITISSPTVADVTVTTPKIPGLEIRVPKGTVITDHDGRAVTQLSITPLKLGRTAYPLAPGMQPNFFTLQPGDATVSGSGLQVTYPNGTNQPPGTAIPFLVNTPTWPGNGWWRYGTGHVSADATQIVPDAGVAWHNISLGGYPVAPPPDGPKPKPCPVPDGPNGPNDPGGGGGAGDGNVAPPPSGPPACSGDPVSVGTGLFEDQHTDLTITDVETVVLSRGFRQLDNTVRDFGIGMSDSLSYYVVADIGGGRFDLYGPHGEQFAYAPTATTGVYQAVGSPTAFAGSKLIWGGNPDTYGPFSITLTNGTVLTFGNPAYVTQITDRFGNAIHINRFPEGGPTPGNIQNVTSPNGSWLTFTYGNCVTASPTTTCVTKVQDSAGRSVSYAYDANGRLTAMTDPIGAVTRYGWAACTNAMTCTEMLTVTDPNGHVTTNAYDPVTGRVAGQTDPRGGTWTYTYTTSGAVITQTTVMDPKGVQDAYSFDSDGAISSITDAVGTPQAQTSTVSFDPTTHLLTSETDAIGRTTTYSYDPAGNLTNVTELSGTAQPTTYSFTYESTYNRIVTATDPLGHATTVAYNDAKHTETSTDALGHQTTVKLNRAGQPVRRTDPLGNATFYSYLSGQLVAVTDPLGNATGVYDDALGRPLQVTDALGNTTSYTWTPTDQMASETTPLGAVTTYTYDPKGNPAALTDGNGHTTSFAYDANDNRVTRTDPLGKSSHSAYDANNNPTMLTDANGDTNTFAYDVMNRLRVAKYGVAGSAAERTITYTYDLADRPLNAVDSLAGTYGFTYDGLDDVLTSTSPQGTITHTYDAAGLTKSAALAGEQAAESSYDGDNRLIQITQGSASVSMGYDAASRATSLTLPDGITRATTFDAASRPTSLAFTRGAKSVGALQYVYDDDGRVSSVSGSLATVNLPAAVGSSTYNADNALVARDGTAYTYDDDGNLTSDGANTYRWNTNRQLTSMSGAASATYTYDPFGRRSAVKVGGKATSYLFDGTTVVEELAGGSPKLNLLTTPSAGTPPPVTTNTLDRELPGQIFQLTTPSGTDSSFVTNPLGSTLALGTATGKLATTYTYEPGGAVTTSGSASVNTFTFAGSQGDSTGLDLMGARYYSPARATFISRDPIGFAGGTSNLYSYAGTDPVNNSDPTGCVTARARACQFIADLAMFVIGTLISKNPFVGFAIGAAFNQATLGGDCENPNQEPDFVPEYGDM